MSGRVGMGFDIHPVSDDPDRPMVLGGLQFDGPGLVGHSDSDVIAHACTDALLGAAGLGDIGSHFPPSDPQWRGAASHRFLAFAAERVRARGGVIDFLDLTLVCEAPKVGPHREAIRQAIAKLCYCVHNCSMKGRTPQKFMQPTEKAAYFSRRPSTI